MALAGIFDLFVVDGLVLEGLVEAFEFAVGLGIVGASHDMAVPPLGDEGEFEFPVFEPKALVGDDARLGLGKGFAVFLQEKQVVDGATAALSALILMKVRLR